MRRFNLALYPIALMLRIRMLLQPSRLWHGSATTCPAHHTGIHTACLPSRHPSVNVLCHPIKTAHPPVSCFTPQVASAFRGPPLCIAASPYHEPRCGRRFRLLSDTAGAHGGRRRFTGAPGSYPDRSRPRPPDGSPGETPRPHPHPQSNRRTSCSSPPHPVSLSLTAPFPPTLPLLSRPRLRRLATPLFPPTSEPRYPAGPVVWRARASGMLPIVRLRARSPGSSLESRASNRPS